MNTYTEVFLLLSINIKSKISENTKKNQLATQTRDNHHVSIRHIFTAGMRYSAKMTDDLNQFPFQF